MKIPKREVLLAFFVFACGFLVLKLAMEPRLDYRDRVSCQSNLKRIGLALVMYAQDNDDTLPRSWYGRDAGPSDNSTNYKWMDAIFPYVKEQNVFTCPRDGISKPYRYRTANNYGSYAINNAYFAPGDKQTPPAGLQFSQISRPYETILVTDGENDFQVAWPDAANTPVMVNEQPFKLGSIRGRHNTYRRASGHGLATHLVCDGSNSSIAYHFEKRTRLINGKLIYVFLTVEDDRR